MSAYSAQLRVKEIGIRKVLGASVSNVTVLLSNDFMVLVLFATVISWPLAWWTMSHWLDGFDPAHMSLSLPLRFRLSLSLSLSVVVVVVLCLIFVCCVLCVVFIICCRWYLFYYWFVQF